MLSDQERAEIESAFKHIETRSAASIDALKIVQKYRGYVSDEAIKDIAPLVNLSVEELDGVATFYNLIFRKPVGKHVIFVCDSISCWIMGEESVMDHLKRKLGIELGQTTPDGMFTLLPTVCLGHCEQAPVMMIDGEIKGNLTDEKIDKILADARK